MFVSQFLLLSCLKIQKNNSGWYRSVLRHVHKHGDVTAHDHCETNNGVCSSHQCDESDNSGMQEGMFSRAQQAAEEEPTPRLTDDKLS